MSRTGRCQCGQITYTIEGDPLSTVVCHCDHCQRQSGGAFSVNVIVREEQLHIDGELAVFEDRGESGDAGYVFRKFCGGSGSPIVSTFAEPAGFGAVKAGTLDDRSDVTPTVEVWCEHRQPWVALPGMTASLDREGR